MMLENALGFPVCLMNNPHVQFLIQMDGGLICITQAFWFYFVVIFQVLLDIFMGIHMCLNTPHTILSV